MPPYNYTLPSRDMVDQRQAAIIEPPRVPRSRFTGTYTRLTAFDAGYLVPFLCEEVLPGDHLTFDIYPHLRMNTPLFPLFSNQTIHTFVFFCPNRLVWDSWERFMGEQATPAQSIDLSVPQVGTTGGVDVGTIADHFGLPFVSGQIDPTSQWEVSALPFRMYNLIYNQWFRDQNIIDGVDVNTGDGDDALTDYVLLKRAKIPDYFTLALPWPQKFTAPTVPIAGTAPVKGLGTLTGGAADGNTYKESGPDDTAYTNSSDIGNAAAGQWVARMTAVGAGAYPDIYADLTSATGVAINVFRQAFLIQQMLERDARGGTRYTELLRAHFGVVSPDFRLQRPEYVGGGTSPLTITPIAQTTPTAGEPLGALGATGIASGQHRASYAAVEHGYLIGIANIRTELTYQQGLRRHWHRRTRYDFYVPSLAQLGEQAILRKELWAKGSFVPGSDDSVFGYIERWHELRTYYSDAVGVMRSGAQGGSLDAWHLGQYFTAAPTLSQAFIEDTPDMARVLAAGELAENQQYFGEIFMRYALVRPVPTYGTPATLGRF